MHRKLQDSEVFDGKELYLNNRSFKHNESIIHLKKKLTFKNSSCLSSLINCDSFDSHPEVNIKYSDTEWYIGKFTNLTNMNNNEQYKKSNSNNLITGYGLYHYKNGDEYEGMFINGKREGLGEYRYNKNKDIYIGQWQNDRKHGQGSFKLDSFDFDGVWENDEPKDLFVFRSKINTDIEKSNENIYLNNLSNVDKDDAEYLGNMLKRINEENEDKEYIIELVAMVKNNITTVFNIIGNSKSSNALANNNNKKQLHSISENINEDYGFKKKKSVFNFDEENVDESENEESSPYYNTQDSRPKETLNSDSNKIDNIKFSDESYKKQFGTIISNIDYKNSKSVIEDKDENAITNISNATFISQCSNKDYILQKSIISNLSINEKEENDV